MSNSLYPSGYFIMCRDILNHPYVRNAPVAHRWILVTIIEQSAFQKTILYDHGVKIELDIGEFMYTDRLLEELTDIPRTTIQRAVKGFLREKILGQRVGHKKSIVKCLFPTTYKQLNQLSGPENGPTMGQEWATKNKRNKLNESNNDDVTKDFVDVFSSNEKRKEKGKIYECLLNIDLPENDKLALSKFDKDRVKFVLEVAFDPKTKIKTTLIQYLMYHCNPENPLPKIPVSEDDLVARNKKNAPVIAKLWRLPQGYRIDILEEGIQIVFPSGSYSPYLAYKEHGFDDQFENLLRKCKFIKSEKIEDIKQANEA